MHYNDYEKIVSGYLRSYNVFKKRLKDIEKEYVDIKLKAEILVSAPIAKYDSSPSGGFSELNQNEQYAFERERYYSKLGYLKSEFKNISDMLNRLEGAMKLLPENQLSVITSRYINNSSWQGVAYALNYSERQCQRLCNEAIATLAKAMFWNVIGDGSGVLFLDGNSQNISTYPQKKQNA